MSPIQKAVDICGSQAALARAIGVSPVFVHQMAKGEKKVPARLCRAIEAATAGQVTAEELLPGTFAPIKRKKSEAA